MLLFVCGKEMHTADSNAVGLATLFFVVGATSSGKSAAAIHIAHALREEHGYEHVVIVNCDVTQLHEDLAIATNKPTAAQLCDIPHVFIGFLGIAGDVVRDATRPYEGSDAMPPSSPSVSPCPRAPAMGEPYHIHRYAHDVTRFIESYALEHGRCAVIVCGGTCYYMQALLFRHTICHTDHDNSSNEAALATCSTTAADTENTSCDVVLAGASLWDQVNQIDPIIAARFHPNDTQRLRRLLQIHRDTKAAPSKIFASHPPQLRYDVSQCFVVWIDVPRDILMRSIDTRVDMMVRAGLLSEARAFYEKSKLYHNTFRVNVSSSLRMAIGYKEFVRAFTNSDHREVGAKQTYACQNYRCDAADAMCAHNTTDSLSASSAPSVASSIALVKSNTRRYARQQQRWLSNRFTKLWAEATRSEPDTKSRQCARHFAKVHVVSSSELRDAIACFMASVFQDDEINSGTSSTTTKLDCVTYPVQDYLSSKRPSTTGQNTSDDDPQQTHRTQCDLCNVFTCSAEQWTVHMQSRRHRGAVKRQTIEREQRAKYGRELPSPKRHKKQKQRHGSDFMSTKQ